MPTFSSLTLLCHQLRHVFLVVEGIDLLLLLSVQLGVVLLELCLLVELVLALLLCKVLLGLILIHSGSAHGSGSCECTRGKQGWGLARLKRILNLEDYAFNRKLSDMTVEGCPIDHWIGMNMQNLLDRIIAIKGGKIPSDINEQEQENVEKDVTFQKEEVNEEEFDNYDNNEEKP